MDLERIRAALWEEDMEVRRAAVATLATPEELHAFALHYNWDDGVELLTLIIRNPMCDRGTALMLYWLTDGIFAQRAEEISRYQGHVYALAMEIERRFLAGFYTGAAIRFDPKDPLDLDGDWRLAVD